MTRTPDAHRSPRLLEHTPDVGGFSRAAFLKQLPRAYFDRVNPADAPGHYQLVGLLRQQQGHGQAAFGYDVEDGRYQVLPFDIPALGQTLRSLCASGGPSVIRVISHGGGGADDTGFMIAGLQREAPGEESSPPGWDDLRGRLLSTEGRIVRHVAHLARVDGDETTLCVLCVNSAPWTVWRNILEIFESSGEFPEYIEAMVRPSREPGVRIVHGLTLVFSRRLDPELVRSMGQDLERYIQVHVKPMSVLDLIGPAMVGPSSSHTAGANRIGRIARNILLAMREGEHIRELRSVAIKLLGSFRDTGVGHRTPAAMGGGLQGFSADDPRGLQAGAPGEMTAGPLTLGDMRPIFGGYQAGDVADEARYAAEGCSNIAEVIAETDRGRIVIVGFSIGGGNVEVRYIDERLARPITGMEEIWIRGDRVVGVGGPPDDLAGAAPVARLAGGPARSSSDEPPPFNTFEELLEHAASTGADLLTLVDRWEARAHGHDPDELRSILGGYWQRMREAIDSGIRDSALSAFGLSGGDAARVSALLDERPGLGGLHGRALAYALAVAEVNAKSGVIVACPTAGSCGILPGVLRAYEEHAAPESGRMAEALMIAGFMCVMFFDDVSTAGADYGCQAEVGAGAAMAASAVAWLEGGSTEQVVQAFVLAIKNCMGLVCDPVAGLVEVPCVKRNGIYSAVAINAATLALAGVRSFVSPDEVILAVREVGDRLHRDYKETSGGGLARTRDGKRVAQRFRDETRRWFGED